MIKEFSLKRDNELQLSQHFKVKEFACKDGSDKVLIDTNLIPILESIREYFNSPVYIMSGYRTEVYNKKVSNTKDSQHCKGTAVDVRVAGVSPVAIALMCEYDLLKGTGGIGLYKGQNFTHIDTREKMTRWVQPSNSASYRVVSKISLNI